MNASPAVRQAEGSRLRLYSWLTLAATALLAGAALFGNEWFVRAGVGIALLGGGIACSLAWRELRKTRIAAQRQSAEELRANGDQLHQERQQHLRVLQVLRDRNDELRTRLNESRAEAAGLTHKVSSLRGTIAALRLELAQLRAGDAEDAEVVAMPRRVSGPEPAITAVELWNEGNVPTVVDLQALSAPFVEDVLRQHA